MNKTFKKIGNGFKNTFVEMSQSLAGWIDDTSKQFSKTTKKNSHTTNNKKSVAHKTTPQE